MLTDGMLEGKPLPKLSAKATEVNNLIKAIAHCIQRYVPQYRELGDVVRLLELSFSMAELIDKAEGYTLGLAESASLLVYVSLPPCLSSWFDNNHHSKNL